MSSAVYSLTGTIRWNRSQALTWDYQKLLSFNIFSVFDEFYKSKQLSVVVGLTDISESEQNEKLAKIIPHPEYR